MTLPGGWEILLIIVIILIIFGGGKIRSTMNNAGRGIYKVKKEVDEIKNITNK